MSVLTMPNRAQRRASSSQRGGQAPTIREESEFDGFWVNVGPTLPDGTFIRLNRGIAVDDLRIQPIYDTTAPERKAELTILNAVVRAIQGKCNPKKLAEGEHIVLKNLQVVIYRRMEGTEDGGSASIDADVEAMLFGADDDGVEEDVLGSQEKKVAPKTTESKRRRLDIEED